jgi:hypothetical protein
MSENENMLASIDEPKSTTKHHHRKRKHRHSNDATDDVGDDTEKKSSHKKKKKKDKKAKKHRKDKNITSIDSTSVGGKEDGELMSDSELAELEQRKAIIVRQLVMQQHSVVQNNDADCDEKKDDRRPPPAVTSSSSSTLSVEQCLPNSFIVDKIATNDKQSVKRNDKGKQVYRWPGLINDFRNRK